MGSVLAWAARPVLFPAPPVSSATIALQQKEIHDHGGHVEVITDGHCRVCVVSFGSREPSSCAVLYSHGNGEDVWRCWPVVNVMAAQCGMPVYTYDYVGYGGLNVGAACSPEGVLQAASIAYLALRSRHEHIILVGFSLGSAPTCFLAARHPGLIAGVLLIAPFVSVLALGLGRAHSVPSCGLDVFDNESLISHVQAPVWIAHGDRDAIVPYDHGKTLYRACGASIQRRLFTLPRACHTSVWSHPRMATILRSLKAGMIPIPSVQAGMIPIPSVQAGMIPIPSVQAGMIPSVQ